MYLQYVVKVLGPVCVCVKSSCLAVPLKESLGCWLALLLLLLVLLWLLVLLLCCLLFVVCHVMFLWFHVFLVFATHSYPSCVFLGQATYMYLATMLSSACCFKQSCFLHCKHSHQAHPAPKGLVCPQLRGCRCLADRGIQLLSFLRPFCWMFLLFDMYHLQPCFRHSSLSLDFRLALSDDGSHGSEHELALRGHLGGHHRLVHALFDGQWRSHLRSHLDRMARDSQLATSCGRSLALLRG